jgi:hypothetical protein
MGVVTVAGCELGPQRLQQAVGQSRRVENRAQQQEATARIFLACGLD